MSSTRSPRASTPAGTSATSRCGRTSSATPRAIRSGVPPTTSSRRWRGRGRPRSGGGGAALEAGALGYSISRSLPHRVPDGRWVPGTFADPSEFLAIAEPLGRLGRGVLEREPGFKETDGGKSRGDEEVRWIADLSRALGRPFTFNLTQMRSLGDHY